MAEEENSHAEHQPTHSNVGVGSSSQAAVKLYATTAEAIANFKPTHREVISGIAPHVFDERKRRRSQRRGSSSMRTHWCNEPGGEKRSSPLRGTIVHAWETDENVESNPGVSKVQLAHTNGTSDNLKTEALWKYLRFDARLFKLRTIVKPK